MKMLEKEDDSFHVTRVGYFHLSDSELEVFGRMSLLMGEPAISSMLESLSRDQQHAAINKFLQGTCRRAIEDSLATAARLSSVDGRADAHASTRKLEDRHLKV
uniref:Uncharacterized protein n=1 Tax=Peronospora matthiolae TaxID=2874970 RepID=A0AAV1U9V6_9STRA